MSTIYQEFRYGDIISLRGNGSLIVTSPSGIVISFPASIHRVQRFRVEELGIWTYEWEDGMKGEFIVVPVEPSELISEDSKSEVQIQSQRPVQSAGEKFFAFL